MARKLSSSFSVILPGPNAWELWEHGKSFSRSATSPDPTIWKSVSAPIVALPLSTVIVFPLWLPNGEAGQAVAALELEMRGIQKAGASAPHVSDDVTVEGERRLTLQVTGQDRPSEALVFPQAKAYDLFARFLPMASDTLHFWKELDIWCIGLTRGDQLVFCACTGHTKWDEGAVSEMERLLLRLQSEEVLTVYPQAIHWFYPPSSDEKVIVEKSLKLFAQTTDPQPILHLPEPLWDLAPAAVREARRSYGQRRRLLRVAGILAVAYLLFLLVLAGRLLLQAREAHRLQSIIAGQQGEVTELMSISSRWEEMRHMIDPAFFGVDLLYACAKDLPEKDVRLTSFMLDNGRLQLAGEARSVPLAFDYINRIKNNPDLAMFRWEAPQPSVLPNNSAGFQLIGVRHDADPK